MSKQGRKWTRRDFLKNTAATGAALSLTPFTILNPSRALAAAKDRIVVAQGVGVFSINPYGHSGSPLYGIWSQLMETLIDVDYEKRKYFGVLAESWGGKGKKLTFNLRKGVKFTDGSPLTSRDVIHSYNRIKKDKGSHQASNLKHVKEMEAPDDHTVILTLKKPNANFLGRLYTRSILSEAAAKKYGDQVDKHPIGTGPFKFVDWQRANYFRMRRNDDYWGPKPKIKELVFKAIPEDASRVSALEAGEADIISAIPPHDIDRLRGNPRFRVEQVRGLRIIFLVMAPAYKPFDNLKVRQALCHAIDRDSLIKFVLEGNGHPLTGYLGPQVFGYDPNAKWYPHDPDKAKRLLAEAGYPNGFETEFVSPSGRYLKDREAAQAIVDQLAKVGVKANLKTPEYGIFSAGYKKGKYPFYLIGRGSVIDADTYFYQYFRTGRTKRIKGYSNPKLDKVLDEQQQTFDVAKREKLLWEAQRMIMEDAPAIPLWNVSNIYGVRSDLVWTPRPDEKVFVRGAYYKG
jgi:ABC-type transport system substrate-binding protein